MTSEKKQQANRRNASLSTGPRSAEGKAVAATNARRHGLFSGELILPGESVEDYQLLLDELQRDWRPVGITEQLLVERLAVSFWRQRRLVRAESAELHLAWLRGSQPSTHRLECALEGTRSGDAEAVIDQQHLPLLGDRALWHDALVECMQIDLPEPAEAFAAISRSAPRLAEGIRVLAAYFNTSPEEWLASLSQAEENFHDALLSALRLERHRWDYAPIKALFREVDCVSSKAETFNRYQTLLDGELFKLMRELRLQQSHRQSCVQEVPTGLGHQVA